MTHPLYPRPAGKLFDINSKESTKDCLQLETRPLTPEHIRRYRKSYFAEPGVQVSHYGVIPDLKKLDSSDIVFGNRTVDGEHVAEVMRSGPSTDYQHLQQEKDEAIYRSNRRMPLGRTYSRGHTLPSHVSDPNSAFGVRGTFSESAKELLYPSTYHHSKEGEKSYHDPGKQRIRGYDWKAIDPKVHRFGAKSSVSGVDGDGVASCLNSEADDSLVRTKITVKQVEAIRTFGDSLGKPRHLCAANRDLPLDHIYGLPSKQEDLTAWDYVQGFYSTADQQPDKDLGRAAHFGWRNIATSDRIFGIPTIRSGISAPSRRSIADGQNYGDDTNSKNLLHPHQFASYGIQDEDFLMPRNEVYLRELFTRIGFNVSDEVAKLVWKVATHSGKYTSPGNCSIADYRDAMNDYFAAECGGDKGLKRWISVAKNS